ncbi:hypothetical protein Suden_1291 [Sulfurimonas denitrificans DSM 1251]|jgi:hypothetical protein|uniref:Uncharacterized protein n=1 Tax=Sulfurimonas denitrificans (strain ATCC 33889 / DSM 1251) TaxID=326298 RepID=Q30R12_SULDN|nr:hypothetical protein [Sulfurimonas denitrificans]ABB44569.1 hypothetical protein Suden_1291 [Sulfurimonas denitrificans DSM 1251]MDD3441753.1 hypothetical protein [Sulfurimonas denitrificans]
MRDVEKYLNIKEKLPKLPEVLLNTIQSDILELKNIDKTCKKYIDLCSKISEIKDAHYVVYSKYIDKSNHKYEKFIFLGEEGEELFDVSGLEIDLYGLLTCVDLSVTDEYKAASSK